MSKDGKKRKPRKIDNVGIAQDLIESLHTDIGKLGNSQPEAKAMLCREAERLLRLQHEILKWIEERKSKMMRISTPVFAPPGGDKGAQA